MPWDLAKILSMAGIRPERDLALEGLGLGLGIKMYLSWERLRFGPKTWTKTRLRTLLRAYSERDVA